MREHQPIKIINRNAVDTYYARRKRKNARQTLLAVGESIPLKQVQIHLKVACFARNMTSPGVLHINRRHVRKSYKQT